MYTYLHDIINKLGEPIWWDDEDAIPRYCEFSPHETNNIYADEVALILIECQNCGHKFKIAETWDILKSDTPLSESLKKGYVIGFADPPNIRCCDVGPTETSIKIRVLEFWRRDKVDWERVPCLEVNFSY